MALFDFGTQSGTLEDALTSAADTSEMNIQNQYAKKRRQTVNAQAASGRLRSGVSNYQFGDLASEEAGDLSGVESALGEALGGVNIDDYARSKDSERQLLLAELIGKLNKRKGNVLAGAISGGASGAGSGAAFGPWGAAIGGVAGAGLGAYGESEG